MTSLERARAHLRVCQESLRQWRVAGFDGDYLRENIGFEEDNLLAALSWVWEEQERERQSYGLGPIVAALRSLVLECFNDIANGRD